MPAWLSSDPAPECFVQRSRWRRFQQRHSSEPEQQTCHRKLASAFRSPPSRLSTDSRCHPLSGPRTTHLQRGTLRRHQQPRMRTVSREDELVVWGANPLTGVISPWVTNITDSSDDYMASRAYAGPTREQGQWKKTQDGWTLIKSAEVCAPVQVSIEQQSRIDIVADDTRELPTTTPLMIVQNSQVETENLPNEIAQNVDTSSTTTSSASSTPSLSSPQSSSPSPTSFFSIRRKTIGRGLRNRLGATRDRQSSSDTVIIRSTERKQENEDGGADVLETSKRCLIEASACRPSSTRTDSCTFGSLSDNQRYGPHHAPQGYSGSSGVPYIESKSGIMENEAWEKAVEQTSWSEHHLASVQDCRRFRKTDQQPYQQRHPLLGDHLTSQAQTPRSSQPLRAGPPKYLLSMPRRRSAGLAPISNVPRPHSLEQHGPSRNSFLARPSEQLPYANGGARSRFCTAPMRSDGIRPMPKARLPNSGLSLIPVNSGFGRSLAPYGIEAERALPGENSLTVETNKRPLPKRQTESTQVPIVRQPAATCASESSRMPLQVKPKSSDHDAAMAMHHSLPASLPVGRSSTSPPHRKSQAPAVKAANRAMQGHRQGSGGALFNATGAHDKTLESHGKTCKQHGEKPPNEQYQGWVQMSPSSPDDTDAGRHDRENSAAMLNASINPTCGGGSLNRNGPVRMPRNVNDARQSTSPCEVKVARRSGRMAQIAETVEEMRRADLMDPAASSGGLTRRNTVRQQMRDVRDALCILPAAALTHQWPAIVLKRLLLMLHYVLMTLSPGSPAMMRVLAGRAEQQSYWTALYDVGIAVLYALFLTNIVVLIFKGLRLMVACVMVMWAPTRILWAMLRWCTLS